MRIMREEPPRGRYWYQNVLLPLGRILKPKPLTAASQRKVCPVLGARARFTAASVRFFVMVSPTAYRQHFAPQFPSGALRSNMAGYVGKSRQTGACPGFYMGRSGGARGRACLHCMNDLQPEGSHGKLHRTTKILSHAARRRGGCVAARGARAAASDAVGRVSRPQVT